MSIPGELQHFHGTNGEDTTAALLGRRFWYLRRSVDMEGADFLVQLRTDSLESIETRQLEIFVLGIVQSKFFQPGTSIYIKKNYCVDQDDTPIEHFFLMCHTQDQLEVTHTYFFNAEQVTKFPYDSEKDAYRFYVGVEGQYSDRKDLGPKLILDSIQEGILKSKEEKNIQYIQRLFLHTRAVGRSNGFRYCYLLRKLEGVNVCIVEAGGAGGSFVLEPRRDLFANFGGFAWGYEGTGPQFLAWSLLTHFRDGQVPSQKEVRWVVEWLLEVLDNDLEWDIPPELIEAFLCGVPFSVAEIKDVCRKSTSKEQRINVLGSKVVSEKLRMLCEPYAGKLGLPDWLT